jgi:hypothetical protein
MSIFQHLEAVRDAREGALGQSSPALGAGF